MKPIKLIMQAFGPYAGKEEIDFGKLENRTMFVISGKTGSGKTTIFDGISFAVYGRASGEERAGTDLRSQFAQDDVLTEVQLEFSLKSRNYQIYRSPQQEKKKERGEGFRTITAKAELYEISDDGNKKLLAANVRDVDEKIKEIVQLDANQFRQILMIPQGEFRKLLVSDSKEKEKVLQRLFHTQFYKLIEEKLKRKAADLEKKVESGLKERAQLLDSIEPATEEMTELLKQDPRNETAVLSQLKAEINFLTKRLNVIKEMIDQQRAARDELNQNIHQARHIIKQMARKEELEAEKKELEYRKPAIKKKAEEIEWAEKAQQLEQQEELCMKLKKDLDEDEKRAEETKITYVKNQKARETAVLQWQAEIAKETDREKAAEDLSRLLALKEAVYSLEEEKDMLNRLSDQMKAHEQTRETLSARYIEIEIKMEKLDKDLASLDSWQQTLYEEEKKKQLAETQVKLLGKVEKVNGQVERLTVREKQLEQQNEEEKQLLASAKANMEELETNWQKQQAGMLAQSLTADEPCAVCGSTEHPHPAKAHADAPAKEEIEAAKQEAAQIEAKQQKVASELTSIQIHLQKEEEAMDELLQEAAENGLQVNQRDKAGQMQQLLAVQKAAEKAMQQAKKKLQEKTEWLEERGRLNIRWKELREELTNCQQQEAKVRELYAGKQSQVEGMLKNIPESIRQKDAYELAAKQAERKKLQLAEQLEVAVQRKQAAETMLAATEAGLNEIRSTITQQNERLATERMRFKQLMEEHEFKDFKHYSSSKRTTAEQRQLQDDINSFNEQFRSTSDRLREITENLADIEKPKLSHLLAKKEEIDDQIAEQDKERLTVNNLISNCQRIEDRVEVINEHLQGLEQEYSVIGHLYDMAHGRNVHKLTFERFVLASFLDDILLVANERLVKMTSGRYTMHRKKDRAKGNAQSGLELLIFDQYTGQERHVKTLSGGESFKAALALALGLAEIVQQYAGGVSLETMFIDEGFGTLDPESLDQAIEALMEIQDSGRLVGVISHVPELKERIDARLEVVSTQSGSYTQFQLFSLA
ncbi:AAA family ATPase [Bacillus aerolatus]|uniref:Nuclease SbcCD subunit C n=1 Tax=Bacillus aerolatus TaxID=2653354 RepID=A0A6I1FU09_9BACI|nr:SMC family ATPase [Bacillus aerolatus]KAB7708195.1 AAA family ATPase [Bacillus aerolatus]